MDFAKDLGLAPQEVVGVILYVNALLNSITKLQQVLRGELDALFLFSAIVQEQLFEQQTRQKTISDCLLTCNYLQVAKEELRALLGVFPHRIHSSLGVLSDLIVGSIYLLKELQSLMVGFHCN